MPECRNRLEQIALLYKYLVETCNFQMKGGRIGYDAEDGQRQKIEAIIACNFLDLQRFLTCDIMNLAKEKPIYFLKEIRGRCCGRLCRIDGQNGCYCNGKCHPKEMCAWLRHEKGQPYCFLMNPWTLETGGKSWNYPEYRQSIIASLSGEHERMIAEKIWTGGEKQNFENFDENIMD